MTNPECIKCGEAAKFAQAMYNAKTFLELEVATQKQMVRDYQKGYANLVGMCKKLIMTMEHCGDRIDLCYPAFYSAVMDYREPEHK